MQAALLSDRGVVKASGENARSFLNGLFTNDVGKVMPGAPRFAALLTPQGKIIVDFIVVETAAEDGFFLDCPRALAGELAKKLNFYKLRAKVTVDDLSGTLGVMAVWDGADDTEFGLCYPDPRLKAMGLRAILPPASVADVAADLGAALVDEAEYETHRIALGVPQGGRDFAYGDTFPHEANMDQLAGVDFEKGCYVGQEVVSRVEHRNSARSRLVPVTYDGAAPDGGVAVMAGDKQAGTFGSAANAHGIALLRLDRVADALGSNTPLTAGGIPLTLVKPAWAKFAWPGESKAAE